MLQGARKTKLGLREFVSLGDFEQIIDIESRKAVSALFVVPCHVLAHVRCLHYWKCLAHLGERWMRPTHL